MIKAYLEKSIIFFENFFDYQHNKENKSDGNQMKMRKPYFLFLLLKTIKKKYSIIVMKWGDRI